MKRLNVNIEEELENIKFDDVSFIDENYFNNVLSKINKYEKNNRMFFIDVTSIMLILIFFNFISIFSISPKKKNLDIERLEKIELMINTFSLDK